MKISFLISTMPSVLPHPHLLLPHTLSLLPLHASLPSPLSRRIYFSMIHSYLQVANQVAFSIGTLLVAAQGFVNSIAMNEKVVHEFLKRHIVIWWARCTTTSGSGGESPTSDLRHESVTSDERSESTTSELGLIRVYDGSPVCKMDVSSNTNVNLATYNGFFVEGRYLRQTKHY